MTHDEPCSMAPDDKHDLISGTCSHLPKVKTLKQHPRKNKTAINIEYMKASIRARVEHPFRIIKRQFGFVKARYKGLLKNDNQLAMLFTLANLFRVDQMIRQWERSQ
ncbi:putative transposase [Enterobacter asburiae]|uniref:Putative transposase n=1 Tax=Enterobacter asburiae TaxID=61645 RepID=A0A376FJR5_ENTAS|nr:putative transposase [Enterobacter asburiae]